MLSCLMAPWNLQLAFTSNLCPQCTSESVNNLLRAHKCKGPIHGLYTFCRPGDCAISLLSHTLSITLPNPRNLPRTKINGTEFYFYD
jgi:hypothetical protein